MDSGFELFDHTADLGVRVWAPNLPELLRTAAVGLYSVIGDLLPESEPRSEQIDLAGPEPAVLLRDFLAQLLLRFDRDFRMVIAWDRLDFEPGRLIATGESCRVDRQRSALDREVKAVTYHGLQLHQILGGYEATFIVDI